MNRFLARFSIVFMMSFLPIPAHALTAYATTSSHIQDVVQAGRNVGISSVFVPAKGNHEKVQTVHGSRGIVVIETQGYRFIESKQKILLDTPNEQERLSESIGDSKEAVWATYLLPGGTVQHTLALKYDGVWVTVIPKWTLALSGKGLTSTENNRLLSMHNLEKVLIEAKSLQKIQVS